MNTDVATIVRWLKHEGDVVAAGDVLAEIETDKTVFNLEAESSGVLRAVLGAAGECVSITQTIAVIGEADEDVSALVQNEGSLPATNSHVHKVYQSLRQDVATEKMETSPSVPPMGYLATASSRMPSGTEALDPEVIRARLAARGLIGGAGPTPVRAQRTRLAIYGAGLGAKQLLELTRHLEGIDVVGLIDDNAQLHGSRVLGVPVRGGMSEFVDLIVRGEIDAVALSFHSVIRRKIYRRIRAAVNVPVLPLVDPRAIVGMEVQIGDGALVEAGAVLGPGVVVGEGTIVDVGAVVAHDCFLGAFSHLSPGCRLSGVVHLRENVLVGVGAAINSTVTIGRNVIIALNSGVMNDLPDDVVVSGVPAKVIGQSRRGLEDT